MKKAIAILSLPLLALPLLPIAVNADTPIYLLNPFKSSLEISKITYTPDTSDLNNVKLFELKLDDKAPSPYEGTIFTHGPFEEIQVRRIRLTQIGSIKPSEYSNIRLVNLDTNYVLQTLAAPTGNKIEFNLVVDGSKPDFGVMVSWHNYAVVASINTLDHRRTSKFILANKNNVDAFDYRNDSRVALISNKINKFPIVGPRITISPF